MGEWVLAGRGRGRSLYARPKYIWQADDEDDLPTRRDYEYLRRELHGEEVEPLLAYDDRAGIPKNPNSSGGGYKSGGDRQAIVFRRGRRPATPEREEFKQDLPRGRQYFSPDRVEYNVNGSPVRAFSPGGTDYDVGPKYGEDLFMVHPTYDSTFGIDMYGTNVALASPLPRLVNHSAEIELTPTVIRAFSGTRKEDGSNLNGVMKKQSAKSAAEGAGLAATGTWAWLHLIAFSMGGLDGRNPDVPENLVAGTSASNYYHLAIESAAKKLVLELNAPLKVAWTLEGKIDPDWHIAERIIYKVSSATDASKFAKFTINTWSHESGYGGDTNAIYSMMKNVLKIS